MARVRSLRVDHEALALALQRKRQSDGHNLFDIQCQTGLSRSTISRLDRGITGLEVDTYLALCDYLDVPYDSFLINSGPNTHRALNTMAVINKAIMDDETLTGPHSILFNSMVNTLWAELVRIQRNAEKAQQKPRIAMTRKL